jgi:nitrile hydratase
MDGIHDIGGRQGFGPVQREPDEAVFKARWEAQVFALLRAAGAAGVVRNSDQFRHAIERIDPGAYLTHGYYGRWLGGIETLLVEAGVVKEAALRQRIAALGGDPDEPAAARPRRDPDVIDYLPAAPGNRRPVPVAPRFAVGATVRTATAGHPGHTRLPGYARGRTGRVTACHGGWVFPDSNAHGHGENPEHLYTVAFTGEMLWGDAAEPGITISLDLFESYLEAAPAGQEDSGP